MHRHNLEEYVEKFLSLKKILSEFKLSDLDAAILASRILELPAGIPSSLYFDIKQRSYFIPYQFLGTGMTIKSVNFVKSRNGSSLRLKFSTRRGIHTSISSLSGNQALLFLCLLILKFEDFESDAQGGFQVEDLSGLAKKISPTLHEFWSFGTDDFDNLKRSLGRNNIAAFIERKNGRTRLSIPPHHISFESSSFDMIESLADSVLSSFETRYGPSILTV